MNTGYMGPFSQHPSAFGMGVPHYMGGGGMGYGAAPFHNTPLAMGMTFGGINTPAARPRVTVTPECATITPIKEDASKAEGPAKDKRRRKEKKAAAAAGAAAGVAGGAGGVERSPLLDAVRKDSATRPGAEGKLLQKGQLTVRGLVPPAGHAGLSPEQHELKSCSSASAPLSPAFDHDGEEALTPTVIECYTRVLHEEEDMPALMEE